MLSNNRRLRASTMSGPARLAAALAAAALALAAADAFAVHPAHASEGVVTVADGQQANLPVAKGKTRTVRTAVPFSEIVVGDPSVATVNPVSSMSFHVMGASVGSTGISLFDDQMRMVATLDVQVTADTGQISGTIRDSVSGADVTVRAANGGVVLSGSASDPLAAERARRIAESYVGADKVIDTMDVTTSQQVQLNVRFVEINRDTGRELGTHISAAYATGGASFSFNSSPGPATGGSGGSVIGSLLDAGHSIDVAIEALERRGVARRLAEPNLIARSGETASFLAGGEFPIPVSEENGRVTVEYKKFGVGLEFTPRVMSGGLIALDIEPEVSAIDHTASYRIGAIAIPGFSVRRARTSVDLKSGQSFMVAGLLQQEGSMNAEKVPGLGSLPVLGALFSSRSYQRRETDLVIIVTPHLVQPMDPTVRAATPVDGTRAATDAEFFLGGMEQASTGGVQAAGGHFLELR